MTARRRPAHPASSGTPVKLSTSGRVAGRCRRGSPTRRASSRPPTVGVGSAGLSGMWTHPPAGGLASDVRRAADRGFSRAGGGQSGRSTQPRGRAGDEHPHRRRARVRGMAGQVGAEPGEGLRGGLAGAAGSPSDVGPRPDRHRDVDSAAAKVLILGEGLVEEQSCHPVSSNTGTVHWSSAAFTRIRSQNGSSPSGCSIHDSIPAATHRRAGRGRLIQRHFLDGGRQPPGGPELERRPAEQEVSWSAADPTSRGSR